MPDLSKEKAAKVLGIEVPFRHQDAMTVVLPAYRKACKEGHPDKQKGSLEATQWTQLLNSSKTAFERWAKTGFWPAVPDPEESSDEESEEDDASDGSEEPPRHSRRGAAAEESDDDDDDDYDDDDSYDDDADRQYESEEEFDISEDNDDMDQYGRPKFCNEWVFICGTKADEYNGRKGFVGLNGYNPVSKRFIVQDPRYPDKFIGAFKSENLRVWKHEWEGLHLPLLGRRVKISTPVIQTATERMRSALRGDVGHVEGWSESYGKYQIKFPNGESDHYNPQDCIPVDKNGDAAEDTSGAGGGEFSTSGSQKKDKKPKRNKNKTKSANKPEETPAERRQRKQEERERVNMGKADEDMRKFMFQEEEARKAATFKAEAEAKKAAKVAEKEAQRLAQMQARERNLMEKEEKGMRMHLKWVHDEEVRAAKRAAQKARKEQEAVEKEEKRKKKEEEKVRRKAEEAEAKAKAEVEAKVRAEQEEKERAERKVREAAEAEERAKAAAEAKVRAKEEREAKAKQEKEDKVRRDAEALEKAEAEAKARREAKEQAKARKEAEQAEKAAKWRAQEAARLKAAAEARAKSEAEARALAEAEAEARAEAEAASFFASGSLSEEVQLVLDKAGLNDYAESFADNGLTELSHLADGAGEALLKSLGVKFGPRIHFKKELKDALESVPDDPAPNNAGFNSTVAAPVAAPTDADDWPSLSPARGQAAEQRPPPVPVQQAAPAAAAASATPGTAPSAPGFVFLCSPKALQECLEVEIFGSPDARHLDVMQAHIGDYTDIFLYDYLAKQIYGPFRAAGSPMVDRQSTAFGGRFPAQLPVRREGSALSGSSQSISFKLKFGPVTSAQVQEIKGVMALAPEPPTPTPTPGTGGGGRQTQAAASPAAPQAASTTAGNAFVVYCSGTILQESLQRHLLGLKETDITAMTQHIQHDSAIFLHNYSTREVLGPFQRSGSPAIDIAPEAFGGRYPAQVPFQMPKSYQKSSVENLQLAWQILPGPLTAAQLQELQTSLVRNGTITIPSRASQPPSRTNGTSAPRSPGSGGQTGFMFVCNKSSEKGCLGGLLGLPAKEIGKMNERISDETPLFLYNFSTRTVFGIFKPKGRPGLNLDPSAWKGRFPAQIRFDRTAVDTTTTKASLSFTPKEGPLTVDQVNELSTALGASDPDEMDSRARHDTERANAHTARMAERERQQGGSAASGGGEGSRPAQTQARAPARAAAAPAPAPVRVPAAAPARAPAVRATPVPARAPAAVPARASAPARAPAAAARAPLRPTTNTNSTSPFGNTGYVFLCSKETANECLDESLLGLPRGALNEMTDIRPDAALVLYNFQAKVVYGVFLPDGVPALDIVKKAWKGKFPAQLRFRRTNFNGTVASREFSFRMKSGPLNKAQVDEVKQIFSALTPAQR